MYDLIIIGMGISGISAGIYAKRAGLNVLMLEGAMPGGTLNIIPNVENYPGLSSISGSDFANKLFNEIINLKIDYKLEKVTDVILEDTKTIKTKNNVYQSKYLLIATGRSPKFLGLKDEEKYLGKGISTCALCDGNLFKGEDVAVVGGGSSALSEALYLSKIVKNVYLIHRRAEFRGEEILSEKVKNTSNIKLILNEEIKELITKDDKLIGLNLKNQKIDIKALFIYIGFTPNTDFLKNTGISLEDGYILTNDKGETNIPKVYASGDVIKKDIYQLINAASEGATTVINIKEE
ncbi:MAG: FAD-dependent oxidoreductase [Ruminococcus sp.]|nr:FAD-dependent oxidoreductase [Ruminococcus sp.]